MSKHYRFVVTQELEDGFTRTYAVWATKASEAIKRTKAFIKQEGYDFMVFDYYYLIPRISDDKVDFEIN